MKFAMSAVFLVCMAFVAVGQAPKLPDRPKPQKHGRGLKLPPLAKRLAMHQAALKRNGKRAYPHATAPAWDSRTLGVIPPIVDQGQCGSCWDFSGSGMLSVAFISAGYGKNDGTFAISEQYTLDCGSNGGCNGDDNTTVLEWALKKGIPTTAQYGPYVADAQRCKDTSGMTLWKIAAWGYCDPTNTDGVSDTQKIKDAIVQYRCVGCAVAAGGTAFWDSGSGVDTGRSNSIDHDVILVGWDDSKDCGDGSKGAWLMRNSWGTGWGSSGYAWVKYGADSIGTEAVWCSAAPLPPPTPPPGPTPPPVPPGPPVPPAPPMPGDVAITLTADQVAAVLAQANAVAITETTTLRDLLDAIDRVRARRSEPRRMPLAPRSPCGAGSGR